MARPGIDVVIPFAGSEAALLELLTRLRALDIGERDRIIVADNRAPSEQRAPLPAARVLVVTAPELATSYHARNQGAAAGDADWIVFLDADVDWDAGLLEDYFDPDPAASTAVLAGEISDAPLDNENRATLAERYAVSRATMAASRTLDSDHHPPYAQTANCAVRRAAFEALGGFNESLRSGGDADLCFRLQAAGWKLEYRSRAVAVHRNRKTVGSLLAQRARHGAGAAWLNRRYPGTFPPRPLGGLALWTVREATAWLRGAAGRSDGSDLMRLLDVAVGWTFELGRLRDNVVRDAPGGGAFALRPRAGRRRVRSS